MPDSVEKLRKDLNELIDEYYNGNFTSSQDFNKYIRFNSRMKVPVVTTLSTTCEIGELCSYSGKLYHCSAVNTWTSQT